MHQPVTGSATASLLRRPAAGLAARGTVLVVLALTALLGAGLLQASLSTGLADRLVQSAGQARGGAFTQDLVAHFGERLRFAAFCFLGLALALIVVRRPLEQELGGLRLGPLAWPLTRTETLLLTGLTLVGAVVRLSFMTQPMRYDEALTFNEFASRPLYYGLSYYPDPNNHLLNTLLMHLSSSVLGNQPWVLRLPALAAGVLLTPATYGLLRVLYRSKSAAVLAAALVAGSSYLVEYSTNGRGYTLQALCFVVLFGLTAWAIRRDNPAVLLLAAVAGALGAYTVPTMLYGVAIVCVWAVLAYRRASLTRLRPSHAAAALVVLALLVMLLYLPVLIVSGADKLSGNRFVVALAPSELAAELPRSLLRTWGFWNRDIPLPFELLLIVGLIGTTVAEIRARSVPLVFIVLVVSLGLVVVQRVAPFERVWLFLLPLYLGVASVGLLRIVDRWVQARLAVAGLSVVLGGSMVWLTLTSGSVLGSDETGTFPDAARVAAALRGRAASGDAVVVRVETALPELQYYFPRNGLPIDTLVQPPDTATHLFLVAPNDTLPDVVGWSHPELIERLPATTVYELQRA